jgi:hypothetical protein
MKKFLKNKTNTVDFKGFIVYIEWNGREWEAWIDPACISVASSSNQAYSDCVAGL